MIVHDERSCTTSKLECSFVLYALGYTAVYVPIFVIVILRSPQQFFSVLLPFHLLGMTQNLVAFVLTIRDLYVRRFSQPNQKPTWLLLIVTTGGVGRIVYIFKYALKPRSPSTSA